MQAAWLRCLRIPRLLWWSVVRTQWLQHQQASMSMGSTVACDVHNDGALPFAGLHTKVAMWWLPRPEPCCIVNFD